MKEVPQEIIVRAKFVVGMPVHWRGTVYRITKRYWQQWSNSIVYDLKELKPSGYPRYQDKVQERELDLFVSSRPAPEI